eukprot:scaffold5_cov112-Isochrysis_galbana.AAC.4
MPRVTLTFLPFPARRLTPPPFPAGHLSSRPGCRFGGASSRARTASGGLAVAAATQLRAHRYVGHAAHLLGGALAARLGAGGTARGADCEDAGGEPRLGAGVRRAAMRDPAILGRRRGRR